MGISSHQDTSFVFNLRIFLNILTTIAFTFSKQDSLPGSFFCFETYFSIAGMRQKKRTSFGPTPTYFNKASDQSARQKRETRKAIVVTAEKLLWNFFREPQTILKESI